MDPRTSPPPNKRPRQLSPLMEAIRRTETEGVPNFCPYGCGDEELDSNGHCAHLIGFYNGGTTYEPRMIRKEDGRIIVSGAARKPMRKGFFLVQITTSSRVYSSEPIPALAAPKPKIERAVSEALEHERRLLAQVEAIRNPQLEGEWVGTVYDQPEPPAK